MLGRRGGAAGVACMAGAAHSRGQQRYAAGQAQRQGAAWRRSRQAPRRTCGSSPSTSAALSAAKSAATSSPANARAMSSRCDSPPCRLESRDGVGGGEAVGQGGRGSCGAVRSLWQHFGRVSEESSTAERPRKAAASSTHLWHRPHVALVLAVRRPLLLVLLLLLLRAPRGVPRALAGGLGCAPLLGVVEIVAHPCSARV